MNVKITRTAKGWIALAGTEIVAWGVEYSDVTMICKENGWKIAR